MPSQKPSILERVLRRTRKKPEPRRTNGAITIMDLPRELRQEILLLSLGDADDISAKYAIGNNYAEHFLHKRRHESLSKRTKALQAVHPCLSDDVAYVVGKWWEDYRRKKLALREEIRVFRKGYLDGSMLQDWNQTAQNQMFEIAVFARVIAILEYYHMHPVKGVFGSLCTRFGVGDRLTRSLLGMRMPSTMQEHIEVARVFLRLPENEPDEELETS
ncbi:hypothetical protein BLS_009017 [Venturia inaequalis]|uniref:Uncharacterized protein n=1 Tax=Venturia inaequalis TaxID=5025 RepID=A0A8H3VAA6_VENIN|nr:hypothetical protein BLS_009017 [Venturia inaequalis]